MVAVPRRKPEADPIASELVRRLVERFQPDWIYLFGSRLRGDFRDTSDYDLVMVFSDETRLKELERRSRIEEIGGEEVLTDVKAWSRAGFESELHLLASMPSTILREGKLLYAKDVGETLRYSSGRQPELVVREGAVPQDDPVLIRNTSRWLKKAKHDLVLADFARGHSPEYNDESLFHSQQAVEKVVKAYLVWNDKPAKKFHDLEELSSDCFELDPTLEPVLSRSYGLSVWTIDGRYPIEEESSAITEAEEGLAIARAVYDAILERLPENMAATFRLTKKD